MIPSRTIRVLKRDGAVERFNRHKLRACLLRATSTPYSWDPSAAEGLAKAVSCYLARRGVRCISSAAVLEMALAALRAVGHDRSAGKLERAHQRRLRLRDRLHVDHGGGRITRWSKHWLVAHARRRWSLSQQTARILAGKVERRLLYRGKRVVPRSDVLGMLDRLVGAFGLLMACPTAANDRAHWKLARPAAR